MADINWDEMLDEGRHLLALQEHPGWKVLTRELKGAADSLLVEMMAAKESDRMALLAKEYAVLRTIETKPASMARIISMQYERHTRDVRGAKVK